MLPIDARNTARSSPAGRSRRTWPGWMPGRRSPGSLIAADASRRDPISAGLPGDSALEAPLGPPLVDLGQVVGPTVRVALERDGVVLGTGGHPLRLVGLDQLQRSLVVRAVRGQRGQLRLAVGLHLEVDQPLGFVLVG